MSSFTVIETTMRIRCSLGVLASVLTVYACGDSSGPGGVGPLAALATLSGNSQTALAGTALPDPVVIVPRDASGNTVTGQTATFTVTAGGGFLSSSTGQANSDGTITAPTWTLGKTAVPQKMQVAIGGTTTEVDATVQTAYSIEIRFFGRPLTSGQEALFTSASARIRAMIVGALPPVDVTGADVSGCTGTSTPPLTGTVAGLVIYASLDSIDGPQKTLARAGPCFVRVDDTGVLDYRTAIGVMQFDTADVGRLAAANALEETIVHEMLHVVGFGAFWGPDEKNLLINAGAPGSAYIGAGGVAGCRAIGGTATCASSVPVEDCVGQTNCGPGNQDGHWRESTFGRELMTGFINSGSNPLSVMTIRSFEDLDYTVNTAAADIYTLAFRSLSAGTTAAFSSLLQSRVWERPLGVPIKALPTVRSNSRSAR
jgi:hypothetical protein